MKSPAKTVQQDPQPTLKPVAGVVPAKTPARAKMPDANAVKTAEPALTAAKRTVAAPAAPVPAPAKAGRPSRLSQITVPSMAQSVASTAAKSSYSTPAPSQVQMAVPVAAPKKDTKLANNWKAKSAEELSDAEILAMPDSEYMNEKQVAFFRHKLVLLKQDMHNNAGETTEHLREDTVVVPDPADRATIEEEHALELRTRDRERKLLKKIEQSIGRIDAGDYGYCDETGEPIGVGRLLARPTATLSLEAQQRRELLGSKLVASGLQQDRCPAARLTLVHFQVCDEQIDEFLHGEALPTRRPAPESHPRRDARVSRPGRFRRSRDPTCGG